MKTGNLNIQENSGPRQMFNGTITFLISIQKYQYYSNKMPILFIPNQSHTFSLSLCINSLPCCSLHGSNKAAHTVPLLLCCAITVPSTLPSVVTAPPSLSLSLYKFCPLLFPSQQ